MVSWKSSESRGEVHGDGGGIPERGGKATVVEMREGEGFGGGGLKLGFPVRPMGNCACCAAEKRRLASYSYRTEVFDA